MLYYSGKNRLRLGKPTLKCSTNDSYSVIEGNRNLTYSIGLLSSDEAVLSGAVEFRFYMSEINFYLYTSRNYWLLTSAFWNGGDSNVFLLSKGGTIGGEGVYNNTTGVRPVLTIKPSTQIMSGDGSQNDPYVI